MPQNSPAHQACKLIGVMLVAMGSQCAVAQTNPSSLQPSLAPLDFNLVEEGLCADNTPGVTNTSVSQVELTTPSFWWIRDQIAAQPKFGSKLLDRWLACPSQGAAPQRADFIVNQQVWSLLDYLERYKLVHELGTAARDYDYNIRIFNRQGVLLAAYTCDFAGALVATATQKELTPRAQGSTSNSQGSTHSQLLTPNPQPTACALALDSSGKAGFRGRSTGIDGAFPRGGGTPQP
ncbi:MAG: hypothetical protein HC780_25130 [Leptolyngbyaceae cyanobacterium CSU_1_3]|nr:hypothetical protein [Leptolyngbyaceae cyanobacterium CSU_1_3]